VGKRLGLGTVVAFRHRVVERKCSARLMNEESILPQGHRRLVIRVVKDIQGCKIPTVTFEGCSEEFDHIPQNGFVIPHDL